MAHVRVNYAHKRGDHYNPHERIQGIAGDGGKGWYRSEDHAIRDIRSGTNTFYVSVNGRSVDVVIAKHEGREYLKTESDGYAPDNLLALPEPPAPLIP